MARAPGSRPWAAKTDFKGGAIRADISLGEETGRAIRERLQAVPSWNRLGKAHIRAQLAEWLSKTGEASAARREFTRAAADYRRGRASQRLRIVRIDTLMAEIVCLARAQRWAEARRALSNLRRYRLPAPYWRDLSGRFRELCG